MGSLTCIVGGSTLAGRELCDELEHADSAARRQSIITRQQHSQQQ